MRQIRWLVVVWLLVGGMAFAGWELYALLSPKPERAVEAKEQPRGRGEPGEAKTAPEIYGVVKSVDAANGTIILSTELGDGKAQEQAYDLAKDVQVLLDDPATLADLTADTRVALEFRAGQEEVAAIRSEPFRISVKPKQEEVEFGKPFDVELSIVNASPTRQTFWVMSNTWYMNWSSSSPSISAVGWPSYLNGPIAVTLSPGEVHQRTLPMRATAPGRVLFKMGFIPLVGRSFAHSKRTYWSATALVNVSHGEGKQ